MGKAKALMKILVEHRPGEENEIILRCETLDDEMLEVLALLKERSAKITARKDGEAFMLLPGSVYYVDAVDNKTFVYTKDDVYETPHSLFELERRYQSAGCIRIGKSQVVNVRQIEQLKSLPDRRIEITLLSGERLIVSRHYREFFQEKIGMKP
jgi:DNA-binding LytR/AlgR family response regulator